MAGEKMNIAVCASGNGSNFAAIIKAIRQKKIPARLALLICDNPRAYVIKRAESTGVPIALVERKDFKSKEDFEKAIIRQLEIHGIKLIVLAGFMRILSPAFVRRYKNRIINIHPALLPAFKGSHAIKDAFLYGVKITGVTVHFVDALMDHGPIILQEAVEVKKDDTPVSLETRIHAVEHRIYPAAVKLFVEGKIRVKKRKVVVKS